MTLLAPLAPADVARCFDGLALGSAWAVAVSGGADSTALMALAREWAASAGRNPPVAITVDHGLRSQSAREAETVKTWAQSWGLDHVTLVWSGDKPASNVQAAAREARYRLIGDYCIANGIGAVLTAHTLNDQAETVLLRLGRGSGVNGLSAMAKISPWPLAEPAYAGLTLVRPFIGVERDRLVATLRARGQPWIEDASNEDRRYDRVRVRAALAPLAEVGVTAKGLAETATRLQRARDALGWAADRLWNEAVACDAAGFVRLDGSILAAAPVELGVRVLCRALMSVAGRAYPPRHERLLRLYRAMTVDDDGCGLRAGLTLAGCRILPEGRGRHVLIVREARDLARRLAAEGPPATIAFGQRRVWDNRFELTLEWGGDPRAVDWRADVAPVGAGPWPDPDDFDGTPPALPMPAAARPTLPGIWHRGELVAVPFYGFVNDRLLPPSVRATARYSARFLPRVEWLSR